MPAKTQPEIQKTMARLTAMGHSVHDAATLAIKHHRRLKRLARDKARNQK